MKNKTQTKSRIYLPALLLAAAFGAIGTILLAISHASGNATLSLSPASGNVSLGSNVTVNVVENSGTTAVNAFQADITYDATKLQFVSATTSGGFSSIITPSASNGTVFINGYALTGVTGQQTVASVVFTPIATGNVALAFASSSGIAQESDSTGVLGTTSGATLTVVDSTAPSIPAGLASSGTSATGTTISWTASTDDVAVTGYKIYRNGAQVGTSTSASYTNTGLSPSTTYQYTVAAYDAAGNTSAQSTALSLTTVADTTAPSAPAGLTAGTRTLDSAAFAWTASTDDVAVVGYKIYRNGTQVGTSVSASYSDTKLTPGTTYQYTVAAYDAAGNTSAQSAALSLTTVADTTAPSVPASVTLGSQTTTSISLKWTASTDNVAVTGYKIYRGTTQVGTSTTASYTDTGLTTGTSYQYSIAAYDLAGNTSAKSTAVSFTTSLKMGDANRDGKVDYLDLSLLASTWQSTTDLRADFNNDKIVNYLDLSALAANWGK